jgi:hypothetical protein
MTTRIDEYMIYIKREKDMGHSGKEIGKALSKRLNGELNEFGVYVEVVHIQTGWKEGPLKIAFVPEKLGRK